MRSRRKPNHDHRHRAESRSRILAERGDLVAEIDPRRPSGRLLRQAGMEASYVDLADARHLEFDYLRWLRIVLLAFGARRVIHIGGGACALARALAAADPGGLQEVCEVDAEVLAVAREHFGLRRAPGLRVRQIDGRAYLATQPDYSWEAIVVDAFVGARVPGQLVEPAALRECARVAPLALVNVVDNSAARDVTTVARAMSAGYPIVWTLGQGRGNTIVAGCMTASQLQLDRLAASAAADPSPARIGLVAGPSG